MHTEGLFFVTSPIWFFWGLSSISIFLGILVFFFVIVYARYREKMTTISPKIETTTQRWSEADPGSPTFAPDTLRSFRQVLYTIYAPRKSEAHTAIDISRYVQDPQILTILSELEQSEYRGVAISRTRATRINKDLRVWVDTHRTIH